MTLLPWQHLCPRAAPGGKCWRLRSPQEGETPPPRLWHQRPGAAAGLAKQAESPGDREAQ